MTTEDNKKGSQASCDMENFKMVVEHFNQDLREFWNRANFYLLTNAGLFSAFLIIYPSLLTDHPLIVMVVPVVGMAIATLWYLVLRGAFYWIEQWRKEVIKLSKELDRFQCYAIIEGSMKGRKFKSPSYLTQLLPVVFIAAWIVILIILLIEISYMPGGFRWIPSWNSTVT